MSNNLFEVLSPWAEADPVPVRGISPRVSDLNGKKIGLFRNNKRAAQPLMEILKAKLKAKYPDAVFTDFVNQRANEPIVEQDAKPAFEDWVKGVDAVVAAVGD
jgi:hypothetical protein